MKIYISLIVFVNSLFLGTSGFAQSKSLFNGKDLTGWHSDVPKMDKDPDLKSPFLVRNGLLVSMGLPNGHLISNESYANYRLDIEYRFAGKPGNCGVLVHASTPRILYDMFPKSIEVQMMHENAGDFWCLNRQIKVWVNGILVNEGFDSTANQGQIALQAEGAEVEFSKILLTPITQLSL